jgi:hypothetical protein
MDNAPAAAANLVTQLAKMIGKLTQEQCDLIVDGKATILLVPKGSTVQTPLDFPELARRVRQMDSTDEIVRLLGADKRLTAAALEKLAYELNIEVPKASRSAAAKILYIGQTVVEHRRRTMGALV